MPFQTLNEENRKCSVGEIILNQGFRDRKNRETENVQTNKDFKGPDKTKDTKTPQLCFSHVELVCH